MKHLPSFGRTHSRPAIGVLVLLLAVCLAESAAVGGENPTTSDPPTLSELGEKWERMRSQPPAERPGALRSLAVSLEDLARGGIPDDRRGAFHFLSGEISYAQGNYGHAADEFRSVIRRGELESFFDDASQAFIAALEAQGEDQKAAREWIEWEEDYQGSPLLPEVRLARAWNALRRGAFGEARAMAEGLRESFPRMAEDPRLALVIATVDFLEGRPAGALTALTEENRSPAATYLRGLIHYDMGSFIKAAARYQEVAERYPDSPLRDFALLAKANIFLRGGAYQSAAEEFSRVAQTASRTEIQAEARLRRAVSLHLAGDTAEGERILREIVRIHKGTNVAARGQFLLGELLYSQSAFDEAIQEFNRVLTDYFEHSLAATALYRTGRALDALGRRREATSTYQAVVSGYPLAPEAPASAYLAGVGLLDQGLPLQASPYFQLVLDRYAEQDSLTVVFDSPEQQELVEAALCLLQLSYHRAGDLGQLSGVPHLMLQKMPPSESPWRVYALLIDADAMASQARYSEAQTMLEELLEDFPEHPAAIPANRLLAWSYARQGHHDRAIASEERMLAKYEAQGDLAGLSSALLNRSHVLFNRKAYAEAAAGYDDFVARFPQNEQRLLALYQAGLCYLRLDQAGDAVDRWEEIVATDPTSEVSERAWTRAGDLYFRTGHYEKAERCYQGLLDHFPGSTAAAAGMLQMAQCAYNAGRDADALERFSEVIAHFPHSPAAAQAERGMEQALYRLGQQDNGTEVLAQLIERYPAGAFAADAQFEIATRSYQRGSYTEAAEQFRRVVSQFPGYSSADKAQFFVAESHNRAGVAESALQAYEQFLLFFPESDLRPTVQFNLGTLRFNQGSYMRAAVAFTGVLESDTSEDLSSASLYNLGLCQRMMGNLEEARALLEDYRRQYSESGERGVEVAYYLGDIRHRLGHTTDAAAEFERALALDPPAELAVELHFRLGQSRETLGDPKGAMAAYRKAVAAEDRESSYRLSAVARCAALQEEKGEIAGAIAAYRDLAAHAADPELAQAARERASQLESLASR